MLLPAVFFKYKHTIICAVILLSLSIFGCLMVAARWIYTGRQGFLFLIWNLFLAWIPFGISVLISYIYSQTKIKAKSFLLYVLGLVWLLFYPNAPYMITDFIHFRGNGSFLIWFDIVIYSVFIFTSLLLGFVSIYLINRIITRVTNKAFGWLFVLTVLFLSSYGIYLGRFIRWNSWDMLSDPLAIIQSVIDNISIWSIAFSIVYGIMLTLIFAFFYGLTYLKLEKID